MNIGQVFSSLVAAAKLEEERALLPLIASAANAIAQNPSQINLVAQGAQLLQGAISAQPTIGQDLLKELAAVINAEAQLVLKAPVAVVPKT